MPELPEVETVCRSLKNKIINLKIVKVTTRRSDLRLPLPSRFKALLKQRVVKKISRRSKYILIHLDDGKVLIIHLGMSGRLFFCDQNRPFDKHDHVCFNFGDGQHLRFRDPRRFGLMTILDEEDWNQHKLFSKLGWEPLEQEFNASDFFKRCQNSQASIKNLLMNAHIVVGVGNIYANEALFASQIHPERRGAQISKKEVASLVSDVKRILRDSIAAGGTSFRDYVNATEEPGLHQLSLFVYGRDGESCLVCGEVIQRIIQSQRSSFYCKTCQK